MSRQNRGADKRACLADEREIDHGVWRALADERARVADQREIDAEIRASQRADSGLPATWAVKWAQLRQRLGAAAQEQARVEEELAVTLDRLAQRDIERADELHARAAAARRHANSEREAAVRFGAG